MFVLLKMGNGIAVTPTTTEPTRAVEAGRGDSHRGQAGVKRGHVVTRSHVTDCGEGTLRVNQL